MPFGGDPGLPLTMAPFVIPGIVLAIGFYAAYAAAAARALRYRADLILAFTTRFLPIAYVNASAAIRAVSSGDGGGGPRILGGSR
jgi:iron(III) transport system permease protein